MRRVDPYTVVQLEDGSEVSASTLLVATGVKYRTLDVPGAAGLTGLGVYYGAGRAEGVDHEGGRVFVVGGGNSAGQAALFLSQFAASVTLLVRGEDLAATMSRYLIDRLAASEKISVEYGTEVAGALGTRRLEGLRLRTGTSEREVAADALFVFIGQAPRTGWLDGVVRRDERGFLLTGLDLGPTPEDWPLAVPPLPLETSVPGVFAAGDVRHGSVQSDRRGGGRGRDGGALRPPAAERGDDRSPRAQDVVAALRGSRLFAELPEEDVHALAATSRTRRARRRVRCSWPRARRRTPCTSSWTASSRSAGTSVASDVLLNVCGPGDLVGELGVAHGRPRSATVRARDARPASSGSAPRRWTGC